jgi:hypothetical protein
VTGQRGLNVAILAHGAHERPSDVLAREIEGLGHRATVLSGSPLPVVDRLLERRGFVTPLSQIPSLARRLSSGGFDVAHARSPEDAVAASWWRRVTGHPVVLELSAPPHRAHLADRRLRLRLLSRALDASDAVVVSDHAGAEAVRRWLALEPTVAPDADALVGVYRRVSV